MINQQSLIKFRQLPFPEHDLTVFRLDIRMQENDPDESVALEAPDMEGAVRAAREAIADAFGRPGEFVMLEAASGRFTVGAGLWSRRGYYKLAKTDDVAGLPRF